MYKVLIVDDEEAIREGLAYVLDWEEYNAAIVGAASNGKEALELLRIYKPHILITDIRMPVMDGLDLMKEIHKEHLSTRVIVLSGYDEFTYVREAMKYGAENYLLKPVDREELSNSIKEIVNELDNDQNTLLNEREGIQVLRHNTLSRIVRNDISVKEYGEKAEFLGIDLDCESLQVAVIELGFAYHAAESNPESRWMKFASLNICEEIVRDKSNGIVFMDPSDHIVILFRHAGNQNEVRNLLEECMEHISRIIRTHCFSAVGGEVASHRELGISYRQAVSCLDYKLALGLNKAAFYSDTFEQTSALSNREALNLELLNDLVRARNKTEYGEYLSRLFEGLHEDGNVTPVQIRDMLIEIVISLLNVTREYLTDASRIIDVGEFTQKLHSATALKDLLIEVRKFASDAIDQMQELMDKKYSKTIGEAIEYVRGNYFSAEISLKTLSSYLNVNSAYLGRTFKEETGEFFSDYLMKLRIEKAMHYLTTTSLKINEISNRVGLINSNYFYTVFKKHTGRNPGDFRQV